MSDRDGRERLTRRQYLRGAGGAAALALAGGGAAGLLGSHGPAIARDPRRASEHRAFTVEPSGGERGFHSRPDLHPPGVTITAGGGGAPAGGEDPGYLFLGPGPVSLKGTAQYGPLIIDRRGQLVWFRPLGRGMEVTNFASSEYRGEPVLVWWEGKVYPSGYGRGEAVLLDRSYREVARIRAAGGRSMDMHALTLTPQGTALFTCHPDTVTGDLSAIGGPRATNIFASVIQEVDIASGRLLFEWRSLEHIPVGESHEPLAEPYDYLHPNSIQQLPDGNLLISARHTWALYKLDRRTGSVMWRLGGRRSDFGVGSDARFAWQHDARQVSAQVLTVFDNATDGRSKTASRSRGLVLAVDESRRTVALRNAYPNPQRLLSGAMGSVQILPSGRVLVGWGVESHTSEFAADGSLRFDAALPGGTYSYRGLWLDWMGTPGHRPVLAAQRSRTSDGTLVFASWNGATEVSGWEVNAGARRDGLRPLGVARRHGFETGIALHPALRFASVSAVDRLGRRLRRSPIIEL